MTTMTTLIFGIDCATKGGKAGMVVAEWNGREKIKILSVHEPRSRNATLTEELERPILEEIAKHRGLAVLFALDAPLGWPSELGPALTSHQAGRNFTRPGQQEGDDTFFRRLTDRRVAENGKTPLDVGADRIARTALAALRLLEALRKSHRIELAWQPGYVREGAAAIEVYPAATLRALGESLPATRNYKQATEEGARVRAALLRHIEPEFEGLEPHREKLVASDHAFDALICVLAAKHFLAGEAMPPSAEDAKIAHKEGWIWVKMAPART